jgi:hypothetical protein
MERRLAADSQAFALWVAGLAPWKVIGHYTFSWEASLWSARRVYERFMLRALPGVSYFYAVEQNPGRAGYHIHSLWDSIDAPRKATHREWLERYGRNRIEPVRDFCDVVTYCSKYVCKERVWWDLHLSRSRFAAARMPTPQQGGAALLGRMETVPPEPVGDSLLSGFSCGNQTTSATPNSLGLHDRTVRVG